MLLFATVGDYNSLGIPKVPPCRPKSPPARPSPPIRPPLPTTPKHTPKAGVISIVKNDKGQIRAAIGDMSISSNIPHRPAPSVAAAKKKYQESEQQPNLSRNSSSSSTPSPSHEAPQKTCSPSQSFSIQDQDTGAIYEEIDDDVVSIFLRVIRI